MSAAVRRPAPSKGRSARAPGLRPVPRPRPRSAPKRRSGLAFWVFSATLIGLLILGLVSLNALLAQNSFRIAELTDRVDRLQEAHDDRVLEAAQLGIASRITQEAEALGMEIPKRTVVLRIPGTREAHGAVGENP